MSFLNWKIGFEIELMAPRGLSRQDLAESLASAHDAGVRRVFHPQSELSQVPGTPLFHNLTLEPPPPYGLVLCQLIFDGFVVALSSLKRNYKLRPALFQRLHYVATCLALKRNYKLRPLN